MKIQLLILSILFSTAALLGQKVKTPKTISNWSSGANSTINTKLEQKFTTDSLKGIYIPKDLEDCFKQINSYWNDSTKTQVKQRTEKDFCTEAHHGFGAWMRGNWHLEIGSRLSKYFNEMGIYHPDDMSGIILHSYHRRLTGKDIELEEQIKHYQDYWDKMKNIYR